MGQYDIYAMPNVSAEGGLFEMFGYINQVSEGVFFPIFLGAFWFISFLIGIRRATPAKALTFSCFLGLILSMPMAVMGYVSPKIMYAFIVGFAGGLFWAKQEGSN